MLARRRRRRGSSFESGWAGEVAPEGVADVAAERFAAAGAKVVTLAADGREQRSQSSMRLNASSASGYGRRRAFLTALSAQARALRVSARPGCCGHAQDNPVSGASASIAAKRRRLALTASGGGGGPGHASSSSISSISALASSIVRAWPQAMVARAVAGMDRRRVVVVVAEDERAIGRIRQGRCRRCDSRGARPGWCRWGRSCDDVQGLPLECRQWRVRAARSQLARSRSPRRRCGTRSEPRFLQRVRVGEALGVGVVAVDLARLIILRIANMRLLLHAAEREHEQGGDRQPRLSVHRWWLGCSRVSRASTGDRADRNARGLGSLEGATKVTRRRLGRFSPVWE
jgi:hypothetical protein